MRNLLLLLLVALGGSNAVSAQQRTEQDALEIARTFLQKKYKATRSDIRKVAPLRSVMQRVPVVKDTVQWNPFYIWNDESSHSFVIVSGDERMPDVLGYAPNRFDEERMPEALSRLLSDYAMQYNALQQQPVSSVSGSASGTSDESSEVVLETARWGQGKPFNNDCPENSEAGCVATAMSIVMRYHNWPLQGEGSHEYVWYGNVTLSADFGQATYDWENMPLDYETYTEEQGKAVARLVYHAGVSVDMHYGYSASGARLVDVKPALTNYFRYSPRSFFIEADNYTQEEWLHRLKQEIDEGRPLLYAGTSEETQTGHAFVVDGYQGDLLHINWGWNGYYNGFFALGYLTPDDGMGGYNSDQAAIVNIKPKKEEEQAVSPVVLSRTEGFGHVTTNCRNVRKGESFEFMIAAYSDYPDDGSYTGDFCVALVDREGNMKEIVGETQLFHNGSAIDISCKSSQDAEAGDSLWLFTRQTGTEELLPVILETGELARVPAFGNEPPTIDFIWEDPDNLLQSARFQPSEFEGKPISGSSLFYQVRIPEGYVCKVVSSDGTVTVMKENGFGYMYWLKNSTKVSLSLVDLNNRIENLQLHVAVPGTLEQTAAAACADFDQVSSLTLSGKMNDLDFQWLSKNKLLERIDLSQVEIVATESNPASCIPSYTFEGFTFLKSCEMPVQLVGIGHNAFAQTGLESVVLPATVTSIGLNCFWGSPDLKDVTVKNPEPVWISWCVFTGTGREEGTLHVPQGCLEAYRNASEWNLFLNIVDDVSNELFTFSVDGIYYQNIPGYVGKRYARVVAPPEGVSYSGDLQIPESVVYEGEKYVVCEIAPRAFMASKDLTSLSMSDSIRVIGYFALESCTSLERVRLSDNIEVLSQCCLGNLPSLKEVNLPESLVCIEEYALYNNQVETLHLPKGLSFLDPTAFVYMFQLREITVDPENPSFVVEEGLLMDRDKNKLLLRPSMLPAGVFEIPSGITIIGESALSGNQLKKIIIPESVVRLETYSIEACYALEEIQVLSSIPPFVEEYTFDSWCLEHTVLKVPAGMKAVYEQAVGWGEFQTIEELDETSVVLPEADVSRIELTADCLNITATAPVGYSIYSFDGILMRQGRLDAGQNRIPLRFKGNLIIKIGNRTYKIVAGS